MTAQALQWQPHPDVWLVVGGLVVAWWWALRSLAPRHAPGGRAATSRQRWCFAVGALLLWLGSDWPLHDLAEAYLYSLHMVQHLLFQLVAAPLLILGTPAWLWRLLLGSGIRFALARTVTQPLNAVAIVGSFTALIHVPLVVDTIAAHHWLHFLAHVALMAVAWVMWWPVISPLPELPHLSYPARMGYLFVHSLVPTVPASFLTYSGTAFYDWYAQAPRLVPGLDPVVDLQLAGLVMKIVGGLILWAVIAVLWFRWAAEQATGGPDSLYWPDIAPEVAAAAPAAEPPPPERDDD